jgi:glycolate oxidase iron-sulfur subunit
MQTRFDAAQLAHAETAAAAGAIRKCVHCGFCTATCPTYVLLGNELDSPRGRIYLIKNMLERNERPDPAVVKHLDRCLSCLSCETHCPSGVSYRRVIDRGRAYVEQHYRRPLAQRVLRAFLAYTLPRPALLRASQALAGLVQPFEGWIARQPALAPLAALLRLRGAARAGSLPATSARASPEARTTRGPGSSAPVVPAPASMPTCAPAFAPAPTSETRRLRVAVAGGCVGAALAPGIAAATVRLLERAGCEVVEGGREGCCGALSHHLGREEEARRFARAQIDAWTGVLERAPLDAIVVTTSGCGPVIRDYGHLLAEDPAYREPAARIAALARDVSEVLVRTGLPAPALRAPMRIAYHPACSLQHGSQVTSEPRRLLEQAGFEVAVPAESHLCCGSAGVYNILEPAIGRALGERKVAALAALAPDLIVSGNIGCLTQLRSLGGAPAVHLAELLDWATGGPAPAALAAVGSSRGAPADESALFMGRRA